MLKLSDYASYQTELIALPLDRSVFLSGPAGSGKTTAGVARMLHLLQEGVPADRILVLTPQRTLAVPYDTARRDPGLPPGGQISIATVGGLARRMVDLFWPLVVEEAGFGQPDARPVFLTLETAQYFMARVVGAQIDEKDYFQGLTLDRNRLYSQIIDNLNKAAVVGFPCTQIAERLKAAWVGEQSQTRVYDQAQECALLFRRYCLEHNLLDFSLQMEVFYRHLWPEPICRHYLLSQYPHLIVDNVEEDTPVAHDLLRDWLRDAASALLIYDEGGGHRLFLGADPESAASLAEGCDTRLTFTGSFVTSPGVEAFEGALTRALAQVSEGASHAVARRAARAQAPQVREVMHYDTHRYYPEMLDWVAEAIAGLVHNEGVPPSEIVVLAPFLTDVLRFSLVNRLERLEVPVRSHRPSRALRDEPATQCLLTLAALAYPAWGLCPTAYDVAYALMAAIEELDLVRAQLLAEILYRPREGQPRLESFEGLKPEVQQRITYMLGGRYEVLRRWLEAYAVEPVAELDLFLSRLFGEVLSQPGFGFHRDFDAARVAANLVESIQKFRWITEGLEGELPLGLEYVRMVQAGVVAAQYIRSWETEPDAAVLLAPAYTFLMSNRPVDYQFWLNVGGQGWWERLNQPLTQPYILSRRWPASEQWTDAREVAANAETLERITQGLLHRCRKGIFLGFSELGEGGYEQQGPLLKALQHVLREQEA